MATAPAEVPGTEPEAAEAEATKDPNKREITVTNEKLGQEITVTIDTSRFADVDNTNVVERVFQGKADGFNQWVRKTLASGGINSLRNYFTTTGVAAENGDWQALAQRLFDRYTPGRRAKARVSAAVSRSEINKGSSVDEVMAILQARLAEQGIEFSLTD